MTKYITRKNLTQEELETRLILQEEINTDKELLIRSYDIRYPEERAELGKHLQLLDEEEKKIVNIYE